MKPSSASSPKPPQARARGLDLSLLVAAIALSLLVGEVVARSLGQTPWTIRRPEITVEPGGKLFAPDPVVGYRHLPGRFRVTLPSGFAFVATHGPDGLRISEPAEPAAPRPRRGAIWLFGGSFTHGWSLDDEETYAWQLQERLPDWKIVNFGVGGYGTVNSLLQFQQALETRSPPAVAVVAYASFHDERNTMLRSEAKNVVPFSRAFGERTRPRARLLADGSLAISSGEIEYRPWPLMQRLALVHGLERLYNRLQARYFRSREVSRALLRRFRALAREHEVAFVVAGIDPTSRRMLDSLEREGFVSADISVDPGDPRYAARRDGVHPNPEANRAYAEKLAALLGPVLEKHPD